MESQATQESQEQASHETRSEPRCPLFGNCGGCSSQHIPYSIQLENKRKQVQQIIRKARPDWPGDMAAVHDAEYGYRNRMDFIFTSRHKHHDGDAGASAGGGEGAGVGLRAKGRWWDIIPVRKCPIANTTVNKLLDEVNVWTMSTKNLNPFDIKKTHGTLKYAVIRTNKEGTDTSVSFVLNEDSSKTQEHIEHIREFAKRTSAKKVIATYVPEKTDVSISTEHFAVKGEEEIEEEFLGKKINYPIQGFFQNNPAMAEKMLHHVRDILQRQITEKDKAFIADIYGGVGTFALAVADLCGKGITVESFEESTQYARSNLDANHFNHIESACLDAKQLKKLELDKKSSGKDLYIILDPPRSGMDIKTIQELNRLNPKTMIYISCNPEQLGKELIHFKNHTIESVTVFDLFPQTPHVETVVIMQRK